MKLITLLIVFSLMAPIAAQSQQLSIDSLEQKHAVAGQDATHVLILRTLGSQYLLSNPTAAEKYFQEGLTLSDVSTIKKEKPIV